MRYKGPGKRLFVLYILLFLLANSYAGQLCVYPGPDTSDHGLQLSNFSLSSSHTNISIGDNVQATFYLRNVGNESINLTDKGIYAAVRDKNGNNHDFGVYMKNQVLGVSERVKFQQSFRIDENGLWSVWPAYQIWKTAYSPALKHNVTLKVTGPSDWHSCEAGACPDYCENDIHYFSGYIGQDTECIYRGEQCSEGCNDDGISCKTPDMESPELSITQSPVDPSAVSNITFSVIATDNMNVSRIAIYINGAAAFGCEPPEYFWKDDYWQCVWHAGTFPAGALTYKAKAFDPSGNFGATNEKTINVTGLTLSIEHETVPETPSQELQCFISGTLYDFKYYSKTLAVKACEAEVIGGGCSPTPPYACSQPMTSCKRGGQTHYDTNLTRMWSAEEGFRAPGPMAYQISVPCNRSYLIQPIYQLYEDECQWRGNWNPTKGNFVPITEPLARNYDFHFEPMELDGPAITKVEYLVGNMDSLYQYLYHLSWAQFINISAYDASGIQRIKVNGSLTAVGFVSDETGPLPGHPSPNRTMFFNMSKECDNSSSCRFNFSRPTASIPEFTSVELSLNVHACDMAGNSIGAAYNRTYGPDASEPGNLKIVSVEPVQVVYGASLIKGKATAFRIKIDSSFRYPVEAKIRLMLPDDQWGAVYGTGNLLVGRPPDWKYQDLWGSIKIPAMESSYEIIVPIIPDWQKGENGTDSGQMIRGISIGGIYGPDIRVMPAPRADSVRFSVEIDPGNEIREANETDNILNSPSYNVSSTKPLKIYYALHVGGNMPKQENVLGHLNGAYVTCPLSNTTQTREEVCNKAKDFAKRTTEYLLGVAPVADNKISYFVDCTIRDEASYDDYLGTMSALAQENNFDYVLSLETCDCCGACGIGASACGIGLLGEPSTGAHELLSHGISRFTEECYDCAPNDCVLDSRNNLVNCTAVACDACGASEGFWVNELAQYTNGSKYPYVLPTYYADSVSSIDKVWQRLGPLWRYDNHNELPGGYNTLIQKLYDERDPKILLVRGNIYKNGSAGFKQFEILENGTVNIGDEEKGDYYIVLLDSQQNILSKVGFNVSFYLMEKEGRTELDRTFFVYRMEWKEGTSRIRLEDGAGRVLASKEVSLNRPDVKMFYPNGGEIFAKGENIKIRWDSSDKDNDALTHSLAISRDNKTWLPIGIDIKGSEYELDTFGLEEGRYLIRVRATDGVNTVEDISDGPFTINVSVSEKKPSPEPQNQQVYSLFLVALAIFVLGWLLLKRKK